MKFNETLLKGVYVIELEKKNDNRGFFARSFCINEFEKYGLVSNIVQINDSLSCKKGTLRGMHYQMPPKAEVKIIRCVRGALYDVALDLRKNSPTFGKYYAEELSADNRKMMYISEGFAHGFLTLEDDTEAYYLVSEFFVPEAERALKWNDPFFNIKWPFTPTVISEKDKSHPDFDSKYHIVNC